MSIAKTPIPPYYAVIFTSQKTAKDTQAYQTAADLLVELASEQHGFLGVETVRDAKGFGITVSYWESLDAIKLWKEHSTHKLIQEKGKKDWYHTFTTRICKVESAYSSDD